MSFTQAALVIIAIAAVALGLTCYHLLTRLELIERAVSGGLSAPTRRLTHHEFEQRFGRAIARSRLARDVEQGLVLVFGAELETSEFHGVLAHLRRADGVTLLGADPEATARLVRMDLPGVAILEADRELGIAATPFAMVIDQANVRDARPVSSPDDLLALLRATT